MENTLHMLTFASPLHNQSELFGDKREVIKLLKAKYDLKIADGKTVEHVETPYLIFIGTGGTERLLLDKLAVLPRPLIIVSDSYHNSLAASLEISSYLHNEGVAHKHINYPVSPTQQNIDSFINEIDHQVSIQQALSVIAKTRIGLIGGESDWLISSGIDRASVEKQYGVEFVDVSINRIIDLYNNAPMGSATDEVKANLEAGRSSEDLEKALKMYHVLSGLCKEEGLSALTIKCFDLLKPCDTTACLALSMLNDEGIVAGCEGDIPSLWSMILAKHLCGSASFMSNPSAIDRKDKSIDFAHCTVPVTLANTYKLPSHYESNMGIAVAAQMNLGPYTLFKCGGKQLNKFYVFEGDMVQNTSVVERCRTQIKFRFTEETGIDEFLQSHLGNHVILIPGHHAAIIKSFLS